jgi:hypothetical protein
LLSLEPSTAGRSSITSPLLQTESEESEQNDFTKEENIVTEEHEQINLNSYQLFRKKKIETPYIRNKLIKEYGVKMKGKFKKYTRWINHSKTLSGIFFLMFSIFLGLKLDSRKNLYKNSVKPNTLVLDRITSGN